MPLRTADDLKEGEILAGKYRVERVIGVGGMGVVAAALHLELGTLVAIKLLLCDGSGNEEAIERFSREARAASRLRGEHAVRVFDVGKHSDGTPYMVLEYLVGEDLDTVLEAKGPLEVGSAVGFILQACEAIAEAHSIGIVHRDLKPKNLFLTRRVDGSPLVKVLDFGIAKRVEPETADSLTGRLAVGSPAYMSPEQMRALATLDARSDIWSLGVCLYQLMTGVLPFDGASPLEMCTIVMRDDPGPPSDLRADIPADLSQVVIRCLRKDPAERFGDVGALAEALEPFVPRSDRGAASRIGHVLQPARVSEGGVSVAPIVAADAPTQPAVAVPRLRRRVSAGIAAAALGLGAAAATGWMLPRARGGQAITPPSAARPLQDATAVPLPSLLPVEWPQTPSSERTVPRPHAKAAKHRKSIDAQPGEMAPAKASSLPPSADTAAAVHTLLPTSTLEPPASAPAPAPLISVAPSVPPTPPFVVDSARVQIGSPTSVVGTTASNVSRALARLGPQMTACYREALPRMSAPFDGMGTLQVETDEEGVITDARVTGPPAMGAGKCIAAAARGVTIPSVDTGRARADVPLVFKAR